MYCLIVTTFNMLKEYILWDNELTNLDKVAKEINLNLERFLIKCQNM